MPLSGLMRTYDRATFQSDFLAGLTTAVMLVPQAMAYAMLAGLPPILGLYASLVPLLVYGALGTSRQLAVGPVAMVSLLTLAGVSTLAAPGSSQFVAYAVLLALLVGVAQLVMGLARAGFLMNFLSHPVIAGFTSAAALIIGFSQLKHLLGVDLARSHLVHRVVLSALEKIGQVNPITFAIGAGSIALLLLLQRIAPRFPRALAVVTLSSLVVWGFGLNGHGVSIVGTVPAGLPPLRIPTFNLSSLQALLPTALTIALVGFMESVSVAKAFARKNRYEIDADRELIALGAANIAGGFFQGFPVTGGFSRTAVNAQAGAKTTVASIVTALFVGLTLLLLTPLFFYLPNAVLAAIIMTAVFGLIDVAEARHLWKVKRSDLGLMGVTFAATLMLGIEEGIALGVATSLLVFAARTTRPHIARLGRLPGTTVYRNIERHPNVELDPGVLILRLDAQFYFGNVRFLRDALQRFEEAMDGPLRAVVLDGAGLNQIDSSAETALRELHDDYRLRGVELHLAQLKGPVRDVLTRSGFDVVLGEERFALTVDDAVQAARRNLRLRDEANDADRDADAAAAHGPNAVTAQPSPTMQAVTA